jgi:hypothetical protein
MGMKLVSRTAYERSVESGMVLHSAGAWGVLYCTTPTLRSGHAWFHNHQNRHFVDGGVQSVRKWQNEMLLGQVTLCYSFPAVPRINVH